MSPELQYNFDHGYGIDNNVFRYGSRAWCALVREARRLYKAGELTELDEDDFILLESNEGEFWFYNHEAIVLGVPIWDKAVEHYWVYNLDAKDVIVRTRYMPT